MRTDLDSFCLSSEKTIAEAAAMMDKNALRIVLVIDWQRHLLGTVTDGDLRRAMLAHVDMARPVMVLLERKAGSQYAKPVTASIQADRQTHLGLLREHELLHLPILDNQQRVVGLVTLEEFIPSQVLPLEAVIMAGGRGARLYPLTENTPKAMLPVGDRPLLEIIIERLRNSGIQRVNVTTHHNWQQIAAHFGDGQKFGVELRCVTEDRPLGTAGGLGLLEPPKDTMLVMNGDILTELNFEAMLAFHRTHAADLTMAVKRYDTQVPFGVVECDGVAVRRFTEKPLLNFFVNAGIYLLEPIVYRYLPSGQPCDMPDLIQQLLDGGGRVVSFPIREYWLDIGQPADYERAQARAKNSVA